VIETRLTRYPINPFEVETRIFDFGDTVPRQNTISKVRKRWEGRDIPSLDDQGDEETRVIRTVILQTDTEEETFAFSDKRINV
jgi:hypothetical protein